MDSHEQAETNWLEAVHLSEGIEAWGMYSYGDAPGALGGGFGSFVWFATQPELLKFISETLPYAPPGPSSSDENEVALSVNRIVSELDSCQRTLLESIEQLNGALKAYSQITWIGTYGDLKASGNAFAVTVRSEFREFNDDSVNEGRPVSNDEQADFLEFLSTYGV
ncbi:hypothetical protein GCM10017044_03110 [Kordiimonas sediminis]|uniref:Uncharacterized protein n=1 Tax=Kordiimonas sediminis TaxID=1735581 RepID=A0A919AKG6_9PROT|nr:hypothetical protein [Kordiimonas sediminis]GHF12530.1 hypothetical protein GCM10017044_03110 [Kordiimonas sediminis]